MRVFDGEQVIVRIFFGEADRWHHRPLETALIERLRSEGIAGATVFHGVAGFGARSVVHTAHLLDLSADLPVVIEVVEAREQVDKVLQIVEEMMTGGLVTIETARVVKLGA
jgi:PII-like signaling protein